MEFDKSQLDDDFFNRLFHGSPDEADKSAPVELGSDGDELAIPTSLPMKDMIDFMRKVESYALKKFTMEYDEQKARIIVFEMMDFANRVMGPIFAIAKIIKESPDSAIADLRCDPRLAFSSIVSYAAGYATGRTDGDIQAAKEKLGLGPGNPLPGAED